jgi:hypothetical protein
MLHVNESENDVSEATMEWMMENEDVVNDWIPASGMASND